MSSMKMQIHTPGKKYFHTRCLLWAQSLNDLGSFYLKQDKYDQAKPLLEEALLIRRQVRGQYHSNVLQTLNSLAELYMKQEVYEYAIMLYAQALEISEKNLGEKHPGTIKIRRTYCEIVNYQAIQALNEEMVSLEQPDMVTDTKDHPILIGVVNPAID